MKVRFRAVKKTANYVAYEEVPDDLTTPLLTTGKLYFSQDGLHAEFGKDFPDTLTFTITAP